MSKQKKSKQRLPVQPDAESREPFSEPSPEAKAAAEPTREAVQQAIKQIQTPEQASAVADQLLEMTPDTTELELREQELGALQPSPEPPQPAPGSNGTQQVAETLIAAAQQVATSSGEKREALEQALHQTTSPAAPGGPIAEETRLDLLREELLRRMKPFQAVDARAFLAINHLPHPPAVNQAMNWITVLMNAGWGWVIGLLIAAWFDRPRGRQAFHEVVPPLWFATMTVEYPIKTYFRRRRPFIDIVQAIAVGRKPGTYSFPSGHSAAAFAGAWLLCRYYPRLAGLWYAIAALVGFSRVYVGAHYPGDVLSGAVAGTVIAEASRQFIARAADVAEEGERE